MPMAMRARISRSRSSTRWVTKGCSVPASSSSGPLPGTLIGWSSRSALLRRPEAGDARCPGLRLAAHAGLLLVPVRQRAALEPPVLLRMPILRRQREAQVRTAVRGSRLGRRLPRRAEVRRRLLHFGRDGALDVARGVLELGLHLLQVFELDRAIDLGLDVGHVALRLADQRADGAGDARQFLRADHDERDGTDEGDLVEAEVDHGEREVLAALGRRSGRHDLVFASTSTVPGSIVRAVPTCCVGEAGSAGDAVPSRTPSLKPLTAPPRSLPMFLSFLVPKIKTTTSSTINQCQMLKPPMMSLSQLRTDNDSRSALGPRPRAAHDVHMEVRHLLHPVAPGVDERAKTVRHAVLAHQPRRQRQDAAEHRRLGLRHVVEAGDVLFRDDEDMHGRPGRDVEEGEQFLVFVGLLALDLAGDDLAEDAVWITMHAGASGWHRRVRPQVHPAADDAVEKPDRDQAPGDPARHDQQEPERRRQQVQHASPDDAADTPAEMRLLPAAAGVIALGQVDDEGCLLYTSDAADEED